MTDKLGCHRVPSVSKLIVAIPRPLLDETIQMLTELEVEYDAMETPDTDQVATNIGLLINKLKRVRGDDQQRNG